MDAEKLMPWPEAAYECITCVLWLGIGAQMARVAREVLPSKPAAAGSNSGCGTRNYSDR
jgi:hypothetical protein